MSGAGERRFGSALRSAGWRLRARRILALLDDERTLILRGDLRGLASLAPRSRAAVEDFAAAGAPDAEEAEVELVAIRTAADRNRRLLAALMEGTRAASRDLARMQAARSQLGYDRGGAPVAYGPSGRGRRA